MKFHGILRFFLVCCCFCLGGSAVAQQTKIKINLKKDWTDSYQVIPQNFEAYLLLDNGKPVPVGGLISMDQTGHIYLLISGSQLKIAKQLKIKNGNNELSYNVKFVDKSFQVEIIKESNWKTITNPGGTGSIRSQNHTTSNEKKSSPGSVYSGWPSNERLTLQKDVLESIDNSIGDIIDQRVNSKFKAMSLDAPPNEALNATVNNLANSIVNLQKQISEIKTIIEVLEGHVVSLQKAQTKTTNDIVALNTRLRERANTSSPPLRVKNAVDVPGKPMPLGEKKIHEEVYLYFEIDQNLKDKMKSHIASKEDFGLVIKANDLKFKEPGNELLFKWFEEVWISFSYVSPNDVAFKFGSSQHQIEEYQSYNPEVVQAEGPQTEIKFDKGFYIGKYEIYNRQYKLFDPKHDQIAMEPVLIKKWEDAEMFCRWFSKIFDVSARLPYEHEWEYAARGMNDVIYASENQLDDIVRKGNNIKPVEITPMSGPKSWSNVYHMSGNVAELSNNHFFAYPGGNHIYTSDEFIDFIKAHQTDERLVARGGNFNSPAADVRTNARWPLLSNSTLVGLGFRILIEIP